MNSHVQRRIWLDLYCSESRDLFVIQVMLMFGLSPCVDKCGGILIWGRGVRHHRKVTPHQAFQMPINWYEYPRDTIRFPVWLVPSWEYFCTFVNPYNPLKSRERLLREETGRIIPTPPAIPKFTFSMLLVTSVLASNDCAGTGVYPPFPFGIAKGVVPFLSR